MKKIKLGRYRHYKGKEYEVLGLVRHSEKWDEILVLYKPLYDANDDVTDSRVRPYNMFIEDVEINGLKQPRFRFLE